MKSLLKIAFVFLLCAVVRVWADVGDGSPTALLDLSCPELPDECDDNPTWNHVTGPAPLTVKFDGSGSSDSDGTIEYYDFDHPFNADEVVGSGGQPIRSHTYNNVGDYYIMFRVQDNHGKWSDDIAHGHIHVDPPPSGAPIAVLKISCPELPDECDDSVQGLVTGPAPLKVEFDGSDSYDSDGTIEYYEFDYAASSLHAEEGSDQGANDSQSHEYTKPGSYLAYLIVQDDDGKWSHIAYRLMHVTPLPSGAPTAVLKISCPELPDECDDSVSGKVTGSAPLKVEFDGSDSYDSDGTIEYYEFDYAASSLHAEEGSDQGANDSQSHKYTKPGSYLAYLIVQDDDAKGSHIAYRHIHVTSPPDATPNLQNTPPTAVLKASCLESQNLCDDSVPGHVTGPAPLGVELDGSDSSDSNGTVAQYQFLISGNPDPSPFQSDKSMSYYSDDSHTATLIVQDDDGEVSAISNEFTITVTEPNSPPIAVLKASCPESPDECDDSVQGLVTGPAPLTVQFDGSDSYDTDGTVAHYQLDLNTDYVPAGTGTHTYYNPGSYPATLIVTDNEGAESPISNEFTITVTEPNSPPIAVLKASCPADQPYECDDSVSGKVTGPAPLVVLFDGSDSYDSDGTVAQYQMLISGDSDPLLLQLNGFGIHISDDSYTATLIVTDNEGAESSISNGFTITVTEPNSPPTAVLTPTSPTAGEAPLTVGFNASGSTDSDGTVTQYIFYYGEGEAVVTDKFVTTHKYETPGTYSASTQVQDDDGAWSGPSPAVTITVARTGATGQTGGGTGEAAEEDDTGEAAQRRGEKAAERSAEKEAGKKAEKEAADKRKVELRRQAEEAEKAADIERKAEEQGQAIEEDSAVTEQKRQAEKRTRKLETEPCEGTHMDCHEP